MKKYIEKNGPVSLSSTIYLITSYQKIEHSDYLVILPRANKRLLVGVYRLPPGDTTEVLLHLRYFEDLPLVLTVIVLL